MSIHKIPLTALEESGLRNHGLAIGTPSQLSDVFRHGMAWAKANESAELATLRAELEECKKELTDETAAYTRLSDLLKRTCDALKGPPPPLGSHSWHDLPEVAEACRRERDELSLFRVAQEHRHDTALRELREADQAALADAKEYHEAYREEMQEGLNEAAKTMATTQAALVAAQTRIAGMRDLLAMCRNGIDWYRENSPEGNGSEIDAYLSITDDLEAFAQHDAKLRDATVEECALAFQAVWVKANSPAEIIAAIRALKSAPLPTPATDNWQHLKPFGYAPGDYMTHCKGCRTQKPNLDKLAWRCRSCAEAAFTEAPVWGGKP